LDKPVQLFIFLKNDETYYYICSSRGHQFIGTVPVNRTKLQEDCSNHKPISIRVIRHILQPPDMYKAFQRKKAKSRETFTKSQTLMLRFQMELAIKLNASMDFTTVDYPHQSAEQLENNEADLCGETTISLPLTLRVGYSSHATMIDETGFYTRKPKTKFITMDFIIQPFNYNLWLCITFTVYH